MHCYLPPVIVIGIKEHAVIKLENKQDTEN